MRLGAVSSVAFCASMPYPLSHLAHWSPVLQSQDATGSRVLSRILRQYALSSVASCACVPCPSTARCGWVPCPLSHCAPGCPFFQSRDAPGSHVLCPQDATGSPVLCRILRRCALSLNHEMRLGALSSVASCTWVPCPQPQNADFDPTS